MAPLYELRDLGKTFSIPGGELEIFNGINLNIEPGESLAIVGSSGSGKSTLLHLMGTLDSPSRGQVLFEGRDIAEMSPDEKAALRNRKMGFVFQFHHLLPEFSTLENVAMQGIISGMPQREAFSRARDLLDTVGLAGRQDHQVTTLSGGERQRAAIARAVLMDPLALLADEPTGNLDEKTGETIGELLARLNREIGMTLIVVSHNRELAASMSRRFELRSGVLHEISAN